MPSDYQVGNILVTLSTESSETINGLNNVIKTLTQVNNALKSISTINVEKLNKSLDEISKVDLKNISNAFAPFQNLDTKNLTSVNRLLKTLTTLNFNNINMEELKNQFNQLTYTVEPFISKIQQAEPSLKAFSNALDLSKTNASLAVAEARVKSINANAQRKAVLDNIKIEKGNLQLEKTKAQLEKIKAQLEKTKIQLEKSKKQLEKLNNTGDKTKKIFSTMFNLGKIYFLINYFKRIGTAIGKMASEAVNFNETLNKFQVAMGEYYPQALAFVNELTRAFNLSTESVMNYQSTFMNMLSALGGLSNDVSYQLSETLTRMAIDYASLFNVSIETAMQQFQSGLSGQVRSIRTTSGFDITERTLYNEYQKLGGQKTMRQLTQLEKRLLIILAIQKQMVETGTIGDFSKTINTTSNQIKQLQETLKELGRWVGELMMYYIQPLVQNLLGLAIAGREVAKSFNILKGYTLPNFMSKDATSGLEKTNEQVDNLLESVESLKKAMLGFDEINVIGASQTNTESTELETIYSEIGKYTSVLGDTENQANGVAESILTWLGYTKQIQDITLSNGETIQETVWVLEELNPKLKEIATIVATVLGTIATFAIGSKIADIVVKFKQLLPLIKGAEAGATATAGSVAGIVAGVTAVVALIVASFVDVYKNNEKFAKSVNNTIDRIKNSILRISNNVKVIIQVLVDFFNSDFASNLKNGLANIGKLFLDIVALATTFISLDFKGFIKTWGDAFVDMFNAFKGIILFIWDVIKSFAIDLYEIVLVPIGNFFANLWETVSNGFMELVTTIGMFFTNLWASISNGFKVAWTSVSEWFVSTWEGVSSWFTSLPEKFKQAWVGVSEWFNNNIWKPIGNFFASILNGVIGGFESFLNFFVDTINGLTGGLSSIWEWAGIPAIGEIQKVTFNKIPMMANGGVVSKPTVAMVGEYSGATSNPEIVTPENLMRSVFLESMLPLMEAIVSGDNNVVNAIEDLANRPIEVNGKRVSEAIYDDLKDTASRKGQEQLAFAK